MDNNEKSKKEKGFLSRVFGKSARKAVLGSLLVVGLMGGVSGQAMAQSYNNGSSNGITAYTVQVQPWSNNPAYQNRLKNFEEQTALRLQRARANEQAREAKANAWHMREVNRIYYNNSKRGQKWSITRAANVGAYAASVEADYHASIVKTRADYQSYVLQEQQKLINSINQLDTYYSRLPEYRNAAPQNTQGYQAKQTVPSAHQALTPQQQHDRLVRAYQDAQVKAATQGKPLPKPESYGLRSNDPALQQR